ncbi:MAG: diadenylate cyclase CdaA [Christensenellaceae bacterium]|nr:diadenylate cyclase CdaA [Christensenellaceae bacterium]
MGDFFSVIKNSIQEFGILDIIDILLVSVLIYGIFVLVKGTRASQVLKGVGVIIVTAWICKTLGLSAMSWLLNYLITAGAAIIVILFQPELRRALERIGRGTKIDLKGENESEGAVLAEMVQQSILNMARKKVGALIVFENQVGLGEIIETGTRVDAEISSELIENIFFVNAPLHDGAMVIGDNRIVAAGCFLPLSDNKSVSTELGTRHRAALGVSEVSDAVTIVVSEETGSISMTQDGVLMRYLDVNKLNDVLKKIFDVKNEEKPSLIESVRRKLGF